MRKSSIFLSSAERKEAREFGIKRFKVSKGKLKSTTVGETRRGMGKLKFRTAEDVRRKIEKKKDILEFQEKFKTIPKMPRDELLRDLGETRSMYAHSRFGGAIDAAKCRAWLEGLEGEAVKRHLLKPGERITQ